MSADDVIRIRTAILPHLALALAGTTGLAAIYLFGLIWDETLIRIAGAAVATAAMLLPVTMIRRSMPPALLPVAIFVAGLGGWIFLEIAVGRQLYHPPVERHRLVSHAVLFGAFVAAGIGLLLILAHGRARRGAMTKFKGYRATHVPYWLPALAAAPETLRRLSAHAWDPLLLAQEMLLSRLGEADWRFTKNLGDESAVYLPLLFLFACVPALAAVAWASDENRAAWKRAIILSPVALTFLDLMLAGNRFNFIKPVLALAIFYLLRSTFSSKRKMGLIVICSMFGIAVMAAQSAVRGLGWVGDNDQSLLKMAMEADPENLKASETDRVGLNIFYEYLLAIQFADTQDPRLGRTLLWYVVNPVPRFLWPQKPILWAHEYSRWRGMDPLMEIDDNSGTVCGLSTLMFGEFYANFRLTGVLAGYLTLLGFAVLLGSALDRMTTDADLVQWVNIVVPLLFITRGLPDFSVYLYHAATLFMIFTLLRWAKGRRGHRSPSSLSLAEAVT